MFRKIYANDYDYKENEQLFKEVMAKFRDYLTNLSYINHSTSNKVPTKFKTYPGYIIRILVLLNELKVFPKPDDLKAITESLIGFSQLPGFDDYNVQEGRFPNASIQDFIRFYFYQIKNSDFINEKIFDESLNSNSRFVYAIKNRETENELNANITYFKQGEICVRSSLENQKAKIRSNWKCEIDSSHETFTSKNGKPYIEGHHLVPLYSQLLFDQSLDFSENIVTLCPTCHAKTHFSIDFERNNIIEIMYNNRKSLLDECGLSLTLEELVNIYG